MVNRKVNLIVIHCSASPNGRGDTIKDIDRWHKERGFARSQWWRDQWEPELEAVGYHYVIRADGVLEYGRNDGEVGAHAQGHNMESIGVCMVGEDAFSDAQFEQLVTVVAMLLNKFPGANIVGHRDLPNVKKSCPGFDVKGWLEDEGF